MNTSLKRCFKRLSGLNAALQIGELVKSWFRFLMPRTGDKICFDFLLLSKLRKFVLFFKWEILVENSWKKWLELNRHRTWEMLWVEKMWMRWQWTWMARVDLDLLHGTRLICLKSTWLVANPMSLWFRMLLILWTLPPLLDLLKTINGMISFDAV